MASNAMGGAGRKSNRRSLVIAVVFGVFSAVLVLAYLRTAGGGTSEKTGTTASVAVVYAVRDIPERTKIKDGMIEVRMIPVNVRHAAALSDKNRAIDQITRFPISAGEQVLTGKLADQVRDVGFSAAVPEGKRAVAVGVTEVIASGGHVGPGDFVDVIGVFELYTESKDGKLTGTGPKDTFGKDQGGQQKVFSSLTVLQNIQVLAVADKADQTLPTGGDKKAVTTARDDARSVTLAVTPEQAEKLFLAEELGSLRLSLRPFGEQEERQITPVYNSLQALTGP